MPQNTDTGADNRARLLGVLGAIASGIGVIGFVTVVGGAILWIRFDAVGIPPDKAVAAIPSTELLTTGLSTLIPYLALGVVAVFFAYLFGANNVVPTQPVGGLHARWQGRSPLRRATGDVSSEPSAEGEAPIEPVTTEAVGAADAALEAAAAADAVAELGNYCAARRSADRAERAATDAETLADEIAGESPTDALRRGQARSSAALARRRARAAVKRAHERRWQLWLKLAAAGAALVGCEMAIVLLSAPPTPVHFLELAALAVALAAIALLVGWRTRGFVLFGAAVFVAVVLFGTVRTLVRTADHPRVQAVALLRTGPDYGFTGYYITETNDRVYMARIRGEKIGQGSGRRPKFKRSTPRIVVLPRSSVVSVLIGPSQSIRDAYDQGDELLHELCMAKVPDSATTTPASGGGRPAAAVNPCPPPSPR